MKNNINENNEECYIGYNLMFVVDGRKLINKKI